jgi:hypothetical protein
MLTFNRYLQREFEKKITERIEDVARTILEGTLDPDRYKALTGEIRGLRTARDLFEDAMSTVEGKSDAFHDDAARR